MTPIDISQQITGIHRHVAETVAAIYINAAEQDEDTQRMVRQMIDAASMRLAEFKVLLALGAGGRMAQPEELVPLKAAIDQAFNATMQSIVVAGGSGTFADIEATHNDVQRCLDAARVASINLLAHLSAALARVQRVEQRPQRPGPRLAAVDGVSTTG